MIGTPASPSFSRAWYVDASTRPFVVSVPSTSENKARTGPRSSVSDSDIGALYSTPPEAPPIRWRPGYPVAHATGCLRNQLQRWKAATAIRRRRHHRAERLGDRAREGAGALTAEPILEVVHVEA